MITGIVIWYSGALFKKCICLNILLNSSLQNVMQRRVKKCLKIQRQMQRGTYRCKNEMFMVKSYYEYFGGGACVY